MPSRCMMPLALLLPCGDPSHCVASACADEEADSSDEEKADESEDEEEWMRKLIAGAHSWLARLAACLAIRLVPVLLLRGWIAGASPPPVRPAAGLAARHACVIDWPHKRLLIPCSCAPACRPLLPAPPQPACAHARGPMLPARPHPAGKLSKGDKLVAVDHAQIQYPPFRCVHADMARGCVDWGVLIGLC